MEHVTDMFMEHITDMALSLYHEVEHLREQVAQLLDLVKSLRAENDRLQAQNERLTKQYYGRASERVLGSTLFDNTSEPATDTMLSVTICLFCQRSDIAMSLMTARCHS